MQVNFGRRTEEEYVQTSESISRPQENVGFADSIDNGSGTECFARICRFENTSESCCDGNTHPALSGDLPGERVF